MATSGEEEINSSTSLDTDSDSRLVCSPCKSDGKRLVAVGYCVTCKEILCVQCFKCHKVPTLMRMHQLLEGEEMMKKIQTIGNINQCQKHEDEAIVYHCPTHSFLGCHICFFQHQKTCKDALCIPEISVTINSLEEFKEFLKKLDFATETSQSLVDECRRNIGKVEKCHTEAYAAIKAFKLELLQSIDQLGQELYEETDKIKQNEMSKWNLVVDKCLHAKTEVQSIATEMEVLQNKNQNGDLYIAMVKSKSKLSSIEAELINAKGGNLFIFDVNEETRQILKSPFGLGRLRIMTDIVKADHIKDINVKHPDDKKTCAIRGSIVISENKLLIADSDNYNVKVIGTKQQKLLSAMTLTSKPWSLAKVEENRVVATLPEEKKIVFIRINPSLRINGQIGVNGVCHGVAYSDGKLVVSFYRPHKVEIMDVKGSVSRMIQTDDNGQTLFNEPFYVAINPERSLIYVSNAGSNNVVCLRFDGTVVATYTDNDLKYPYQVIVDSIGNVYVCGHSSSNVHLMSKDCKMSKVLPITSVDRLSHPRSLSYEETEGKLYIGQAGNDNVIKVYRMNYECL